MKICPQCKTKYNDSVVQCPNDGTTLVVDQQPVQRVEPVYVERSSSGSGWLFSILCLFLGIIFILGIIVFITNSGDNPNQTAETPIDKIDVEIHSDSKQKVEVENKDKGGSIFKKDE